MCGWCCVHLAALVGVMGDRCTQTGDGQGGVNCPRGVPGRSSQGTVPLAEVTVCVRVWRVWPCSINFRGGVWLEQGGSAAGEGMVWAWAGGPPYWEPGWTR